MLPSPHNFYDYVLTMLPGERKKSRLNLFESHSLVGQRSQAVTEVF